MIFVAPNQDGSKVRFKARYGNFIGGEWKQPAKGKYFENVSRRSTAEPFCEIPRSTARGHREGARRRSRRQGRVGQDLADRALADPQQDRRS